MSTTTDQSTGYFGGLIAGFLALSIFGIASFVAFGMADLKKPTDRIFEGDFSEERLELRAKALEMVKSEQEVSGPKVAAAFAKIKVSAPAPSALVVPGSPTALGKTQPAPTPKVEKKPAPKKKAPVAEAKPKAKAAAKARSGKGNSKGQDRPQGKGRNKAKGSKKTPAPKAVPAPQ